MNSRPALPLSDLSFKAFYPDAHTEPPFDSRAATEVLIFWEKGGHSEFSLTEDGRLFYWDNIEIESPALAAWIRSVSS